MRASIAACLRGPASGRLLASCGFPLGWSRRRCHAGSPRPPRAAGADAPPTDAAAASADRPGQESLASSPSSPSTSSSGAGEGGAVPPSPPPVTAVDGRAGEESAAAVPAVEPVRWLQPAYEDPATVPIVDAKGEYIVSRVQWPTGEVAYRTPAPVDDTLAPRFGYNVVQVRKHVSWWKYNQKYPRLSLAYINIQVLFLLGLAWLVAFLTTEYRRTTEAMRTPGAMVGEHRGRGPATNKSQKISFEKEEMSALVDKAQNNWFDGAAEASYVGSKSYKMKAIPRPKEFSADDFRKR
ncbi:hypothetical protein NESM_000558600 [Novymonas esmeraldas]|uniref:Uncharacterized protein n=1 Tax=Novymonas esmeraldas TaxID=1808958 RepID=A0AAW0ER99_9TRYP